MRIITNADEMKECALALGNFDGLHKAHMKIISDCAEYARKKKIPGGVLLFENHTKTVCENKEIKLLTNFEEKTDIIKETGIDFVFVMRFDEAFMRKSCEEFFEFLYSTLKARALFAGFDYRFGYKAKGDSRLLAKLCEKAGIDIIICEEITDNNKPISSTQIRDLIIDGNLKKAGELLGRYYSVSGTVVHGKQNGRKMGLPTANVAYPSDKLIPPDGVYFGYSLIGKEKYKSMINVGKNPTFGENKRTIESHIPGFSGDIYGEKITVEFVDKIRGEIKFSSVDELKKQINSDLESIYNR